MQTITIEAVAPSTTTGSAQIKRLNFSRKEPCDAVLVSGTDKNHFYVNSIPLIKSSVFFRDLLLTIHHNKNYWGAGKDNLYIGGIFTISAFPGTPVKPKIEILNVSGIAIRNFLNTCYNGDNLPAKESSLIEVWKFARIVDFRPIIFLAESKIIEIVSTVIDNQKTEKALELYNTMLPLDTINEPSLAKLHDVFSAQGLQVENKIFKIFRTHVYYADELEIATIKITETFCGQIKWCFNAKIRQNKLIIWVRNSDKFVLYPRNRITLRIIDVAGFVETYNLGSVVMFESNRACIDITGRKAELFHTDKEKKTIKCDVIITMSTSR